MTEERDAIIAELKGKKFPVLNAGHVVLMDVMGSDQDVVQSARVSYHPDSTRKVSDDETLIRYLMRHRHSTPSESCIIKLHVKLPIFVERQWVRHRSHSHNEVSARYSVLPEEYYIPEVKDVCAQSSTNRQGRGNVTPEQDAEEFRQNIERINAEAFRQYHHDLDEVGVARELARVNLPVGVYTEKVWLSNLHNLLHFLSLRMDKHAQYEIRQYANIIGEQIVKPLFPLTWQAFKDYRFYATTLSALDQTVIRELVQSYTAVQPPWSAKLFLSVCPEPWRKERNRERDECWHKLASLGLVALEPDEHPFWA